jgi:hypothetical protein
MTRLVLEELFWTPSFVQDDSFVSGHGLGSFFGSLLGFNFVLRVLFLIQLIDLKDWIVKF